MVGILLESFPDAFRCFCKVTNLVGISTPKKILTPPPTPPNSPQTASQPLSPPPPSPGRPPVLGFSIENRTWSEPPPCPGASNSPFPSPEQKKLKISETRTKPIWANSKADSFQKLRKFKTMFFDVLISPLWLPVFSRS